MPAEKFIRVTAKIPGSVKVKVGGFVHRAGTDDENFGLDKFFSFGNRGGFTHRTTETRSSEPVTIELEIPESQVQAVQKALRTLEKELSGRSLMASERAPELEAMRICIEALAPLERPAQIRALLWLQDRLTSDAVLAETRRSSPADGPRTASKA